MHTRVPVCTQCPCVPSARVPGTAPVPAPGCPDSGASRCSPSGNVGVRDPPLDPAAPALIWTFHPVQSTRGGPGPTPPPPRPSPLRYRPRCPLPAPVPAPFPAMSSSQFNKGPSYGLSAEVKNRLAQKYDPQKEAELRTWIESVTGKQIGPDFQKGLKDGVILCELMNKLQPNSVRKINHSAQNWHQLENLSNFIKAMASYGMNPVDLFEANDLFESGNLTQVQVSLLALAGMAKTKGLQSGVDIGVKYSEKQQRNFDEAKMKAGQCVIGLQMGTNKCASQSGMTAYGTRRHLYDPKNQILPPMDHSTISLQMGTNKCASQVGMTAPGTRRHIYDAKMGTEKCDNSSMSLQMGSNQGANQSGQVFGLGRQIYDPKYCPQGSQGEVANAAGDLSGDPPGYRYYREEEESY
ncbi:calponin-2 [Onychostruthus taczanowskii]|uniref:calponin-2 n=1 Tax=Onychostruthus taczanowskii TaxID=356909 RepID=UPI001B80B530|nr:calponin-2 [Onychostruthus taczanowskii]